MAQDLSDRRLMCRVKTGDAVAFGVLYDRLAPRALRFANAMLHDTSRAQDAVQESFLSMWRSRSAYQPERGEVQAWAFGIVRNRSIDQQRRENTHEHHRAGDTSPVDKLVAREDTAGMAAGAETRRGLIGKVDDLPRTQREVIALAFYAQLSHTEIAQLLSLPIGTVKSRMRLGLTRLRGTVGTDDLRDR